MADATGSSAGAGAGTAAGHGDIGRGITQGQYQALLSSVTRIAPNVANVHQQTHQYPAGLIPARAGMPVPAPRPLPSPQIAVPTQQLPPPPQYRAPFQPPPVAGRYQQDYSAYGNTTTSPNYPLGFEDWRMYNNALKYLAQTTTPFGGGSVNNGNTNTNSSGFLQNWSPYSTNNTWANYVPGNLPYSTNYGPATNHRMLQAPSFQNNTNSQEKDLGLLTSFGSITPVVPASPYQLMPQTSTNSCSAQVFEEVKNIEDTSRAFESGEIEESDNSEESDPAQEPEAQDLPSQGDEAMNLMDNTNFNCKDYLTVLRKDLTNSDCGNIGRIVLPKRDAEANLPALVEKDGMILEMDDLELPDVWKFKYRYWPNNKSRMYILETTGEFVKRHSLEAGDILVIYRHKRTGRYVARAVKATQGSIMKVLECQCMKEDNGGEECGFAVNPPTKKT